MEIEQALKTLLQPIYIRYAEPTETEDEFLEIFLEFGGKIQIELPEKIQERINDYETNPFDFGFNPEL